MLIESIENLLIEWFIHWWNSKGHTRIIWTFRNSSTYYIIQKRYIEICIMFGLTIIRRKYIKSFNLAKLFSENSRDFIKFQIKFQNKFARF